jgi:hypothetical protein
MKVSSATTAIGASQIAMAGQEGARRSIWDQAPDKAWKVMNSIGRG